MDYDLDSVLDLALAEGKRVSGVGKPAGLTMPMWTAEEDAFLIENISRGFDFVAGALGRTPLGVKIHQTRRGYAPPSRRPGWLSGNQAAKLLGVDVHVILRLEKSGQLEVEILPGERGILNIRIVTLYRWATRPQNWIYFKVKNIRDPHLQHLVQKAQERWGDRWVSIGEVARLLGMKNANNLNHWIHFGKIPEARQNGNWYIPLLSVEKLREEVGIGKGSTKMLANKHARVITRADRWMLKARYELGWIYTQIAASMKNKRWNEKTVRMRLAKLKSFGMDGNHENL